jgi:serine/threonine protein phosphatase PrpC
MQPTDEWYAVVASDGIWEFLEGEDVVRLSAKKLRLKGPRETVKFLVDAARKRWNHFEDDYCDDITCCLVQFNNHDKNSKHNHTLVVNNKNSNPDYGL